MSFYFAIKKYSNTMQEILLDNLVGMSIDEVEKYAKDVDIKLDISYEYSYDFIKDTVKKTKEVYNEEELELKINSLVKDKLKPLLINSNKLIKQNVLKKNDFNSKIEVELFIILEEEISFQNIELETDVSQ